MDLCLFQPDWLYNSVQNQGYACIYMCTCVRALAWGCAFEWTLLLVLDSVPLLPNCFQLLPSWPHIWDPAPAQSSAAHLLQDILAWISYRHPCDSVGCYTFSSTLGEMGKRCQGSPLVNLASTRYETMDLIWISQAGSLLGRNKHNFREIVSCSAAFFPAWGRHKRKGQIQDYPGSQCKR